MLVLITGQISWSLKKQLEVVFAHVEDVINERVSNIKLLDSNDNKKSKGAGEYQLSHIVELYLAFATRKYNVDLSQEVTERFAKLDIVDLSAKFDPFAIFCRCYRNDEIMYYSLYKTNDGVKWKIILILEI